MAYNISDHQELYFKIITLFSSDTHVCNDMIHFEITNPKLCGLINLLQKVILLTSTKDKGLKYLSEC